MNEIHIIPVLRRGPGSKASIQMNKKLQNARCFEGNAWGTRERAAEKPHCGGDIKAKTRAMRSQLCEDLRESTRDEITVWRSGQKDARFRMPKVGQSAAGSKALTSEHSEPGRKPSKMRLGKVVRGQTHLGVSWPQ